MAARVRVYRPSGNCPICGQWRKSLHREHILPKAHGGTDETSNIQYICGNCHEDKSIKEFAWGSAPYPNNNTHRSGGCCLCSNTREFLQRDHILPKFKGGTEDPSNIQFLCCNCHEDKTRQELIGRKTPHTQETKDKLRKARKRQVFSAEDRDKMRQPQLGKKQSKATCLKKSLSVSAYYSRIR